MTFKDWRVYFQEKPDDWPSYLILADWLEDQDRGDGRPLHAAALYMGQKRKRPFGTAIPNQANTGMVHAWYNEDYFGNKHKGVFWSLPQLLLGPHEFYHFESWWAAVNALGVRLRSQE